MGEGVPANLRWKNMYNIFYTISRLTLFSHFNRIEEGEGVWAIRKN